MADIKPSKIFFNFIPGVQTSPDTGIGVPGIRDGAYLQNLSLQNRAFSSTVNIDKLFVAGEDIDAGETCGMWGFITQISNFKVAAQGTWIELALPDTPHDGNDPLQSANDDAKRALVSWSDLPAIPSGTGLTIITIKVTFKFNIVAGSDANKLQFDNNTATFNETTVTWNTKPTTDSFLTVFGFSAGTGIKTGSQITMTPTQYNNLRTNGLTTITQDTFTRNFSDEDDANPPQVQVEFIYEVQDGKIYLSSGLLQKYANAFRGFAQNSIIKGDTIKVRVNGVDSNQSGLTAHVNYELSDTPGAIQTGTSATSDKVVCTALNETEVQINYRLDDAT